MIRWYYANTHHGHRTIIKVARNNFTQINKFRVLVQFAVKMSEISLDVSCGGDGIGCFGESSDDNGGKEINVDIDTNSANYNASKSDSFLDVVRAHHQQDIAIQSGLILLLMHGMHILWMAKQDMEKKLTEEHLATTHTYYIGAIAGCIGGGSINLKQRKKTIYVCIRGCWAKSQSNI